MATKKEMVAELVSLGANEDEIKDLKNTELEVMLEKAKEASILVDGAGSGEPEAPAAETVNEPTAEPAVDNKSAAEPQEEAKGEVVRETQVQLGIFRDYIYNVKHKGAVVVVENLGYGDVYVDEDGLAVVGKAERLSFKGSKKFEGVSKLHFASASQPVLQILEIK